MKQKTESAKVTLRDIMDLQCQMFEEFKEIRGEITNLKIKVAVISGSISVVVTAVTILFSKLLKL